MELSLDLPNDVRRGGKKRSGGNVSVGGSAPQVVPHSLTTFKVMGLSALQIVGGHKHPYPELAHGGGHKLQVLRYITSGMHGAASAT